MKNIWIMGDIHGDWMPIRNFYVKHKGELSPHYEDNLLILLGDVGANYFLNKRDNEFKNKMDKYPFTYFCIRGNHEERASVLAAKYPSDWHQEKWFDNLVWVEDRHPKILYALDEGGEYNINGKSILVIPGAYSVDKDYRLANHWSWFPGEQLTVEEQDALLAKLKPHYDYILSHTCPLPWQFYIQDLFLSAVDQSKVDETTEQFLELVADNTKWDHWYFGHYHDDRTLPVNATMLFHEGIPFGKSYSGYFNSQLIF